MPPLLVSVIIPCMNEERTIGSCIQKAQETFRDENIDGEIIVSDSSTDNSRRIARSMGAKVVLSRIKGYGNAYMVGVKHARGRYFLFSDADDTYDLREIPKFLQPLIAREADFVIGTRLKGEIMKNSMPWLHRYVGNPVLTWILNQLFLTRISDAHCGMRAISRKAYDLLDLRSEGMEFASEVIIECARKKLQIGEVPISYYPRLTPSKLHSWGDGWRHLRFMMLYNPTPFFNIPGFMLLALGIFMVATLAQRGNVETTSLHSFILGSLLAIIGMQMIATGIYMKVYGIVHDRIDRTRFMDKLLNYHSLETGLITGVMLFLGGLAVGSNVVIMWISSGYGSLSEVGNAVISMVLSAIGIQLIFSALIISIFMLEKKDHR